MLFNFRSKKMSDFYEIPDPKYYNGEFGTIQQPHNFNCGKTFFDPIQKDFRHAHVRAGLILNEPAFDETLTRFGLAEKFGLDFQVKSPMRKQLFLSQSKKFSRLRPSNYVKFTFCVIGAKK